MACKRVRFTRSDGTKADFKACGKGQRQGRHGAAERSPLEYVVKSRGGGWYTIRQSDVGRRVGYIGSSRVRQSDVGSQARMIGHSLTVRRGGQRAGQRARRRVYKTNAGLLRAMGKRGQLSYDHFRSQRANIKGAGWIEIKIGLPWDQAHEIADALGGRQRTKNRVASVLSRGANGSAADREAVYEALGGLASRIIWTKHGWQYVAGQDYTAETARIRRWLTAIY